MLFFAVEDIKCKFKNLRTVFMREYKAVQASRASDLLYVSKWKHYQQLLFLCESCDEDESPDDLQIVTPEDDKDLERVNQMTTSALSGFSSSCTQANKFDNPSTVSGDAKTNTSASYQIFLSAPPDHQKLVSSAAAPALPASPSTSLPDTKQRNQSPLYFPTSGSVQPDRRLSADSRCHWSEPKVLQLISFYSG